jgi:tRNA A-37 threonylcarbamoyl transferase component Bud32
MSNLVTNFGEDEEQIYLDAIKESGIKGLVIHQDAYDVAGRHMTRTSSLHDTTGIFRDLTEFWLVFDLVRKENK